MQDSSAAPILQIERPPEFHSVAHAAMATEFVFWLGGHERDYLHAAAVEAFAVVDSLEAKLSLYREGSDVARINLARAGEDVRVADETYRCLELARSAALLTDGTFNACLGRWSLAQKSDQPTLPLHVQQALTQLEADTAAPVIELVPDSCIVRKNCAGGLVDLGAIGKGFALDEAAACLRDWQVTQACLIAGGSSILVLDPPSGSAGLAWTVKVPDIVHRLPRSRPLAQMALGASGLGFQATHLVNPISPAIGPLRPQAMAIAKSGAWADALSTAAMLLPAEQLAAITAQDPTVSFLVAPAYSAANEGWRWWGTWF